MTQVDREAREARDAAVGFASLPVREQVLDRLADLMLDADDILDVLGTEAAGDLRRLTPEVQNVFDRVNRLMERLSD
jgi:acyl-CoA reductase-like NAD-dependent aldehyde dehydrogenase